MLEDQVAFLLQKYLGNYVRGLSKEALEISVWNGDVELKNMQLRPEAVNALKLPVRVRAGFPGSVKIKVPWSQLGQEPVLVALDRILIFSEPALQVEGSIEDAIQEAKPIRSQVRQANKIVLKSDSFEIIGNVLELNVESNGVLEPFDTGVQAYYWTATS